MPDARPLLLLSCLVAAMAIPAVVEPVDPKPPEIRTERSGDLLPPGAIARLGTARLRHLDTVYAMAFSPDGKMLASVGGDK